MNALEGCSADALRDALSTCRTAKAAKRVTVALAYLDGVAVETISERYGIPPATIYSWLDRFENRPIADALDDDDRSGRPPRLDAAQRDRLADALTNDPTAVGLDAFEWTPSLVQTFIEETFGVEYSPGHSRRLLAEHGP